MNRLKREKQEMVLRVWVEGNRKKLECLKAALALNFWHYNFMRIHASLRMTPAMAAGITNTFANWSEVLYD